jgi:nucleoid-associated protein YgaU
MNRCIFRAMSLRARITLPLVFLPFLTQCGTGSAPSTSAVTGPFDSRGNYVEEWADNPEKWQRPSAPSNKPNPVVARREAEPPQIAVAEPRPSPTVSPPKLKPKPVVAKPKPKPKPKPKLVKYSVKKGDSLGKIASRHGISLSALRRANGMTGDLIRPGQSLTIPR